MWQLDPRSADDARRIVRSQHEGDRIDAIYKQAVASWEAGRDTHKQDFTRAQWQRWLLFIRAENGGFDVTTAVHWRQMVSDGWTP